jgi:Sec1 family
MKGLIFDDFTVRVVSIVYMQSEGFKNDVFLYENLKNLGTEKVSSLIGIFVIQPSAESLKKMMTILKTPLFKEYHIYFTSPVEEEVIHGLARQDECDVIKKIQEVSLEYLTITPELMCTGLSSTINLSRPRLEWTEIENLLIERMQKSLASSVLSLRKRMHVRHLIRSEACARVAEGVNVGRSHPGDSAARVRELPSRVRAGRQQHPYHHGAERRPRHAAGVRLELPEHAQRYRAHRR